MSKGKGYQEEWVEAILKAHLVKSTMDDFELTFRKFLHTLRELEEGDFWQLQQVLMEDIFIFGLDPTIACIEFFYRPVDEIFDQSVPRYTDKDANRFVISWQMKEARTKDFLRQQNLPEKWAYTIMMCNERTFHSLYHGEINTVEKFNFTCQDIAQHAYGDSPRMASLPPAAACPDIEHQQISALLQQGGELEISARLETAARAAFTEAAQQEHGNLQQRGDSTQRDATEDGSDSTGSN